MSETELVVAGTQEVVPMTEVQNRIDAMITNRDYFVEKVRPMLKEGIDTYQFDGMKKPSLGKPGAEKLAAIYGLTAKFAVDKDTMEAMGELMAGKKFIAYVCDLYSKKTGEHTGQGRGAAYIELERTQYRNVNETEFEKIKADLKPDDFKGPIKGTYGTFYKVKDGVTLDHLAPNKAIKMAQKSAFVDAVIRTTGMSDLFTQDVEDMLQNSDEPFSGTPAYQKEREKSVAPTEPIKTETNEESIPCDIAGCGGVMTRKNGVKGPFLGCSNYSKGCRNTRNV